MLHRGRGKEPCQLRPVGTRAVRLSGGSATGQDVTSLPPSPARETPRPSRIPGRRRQRPRCGRGRRACRGSGQVAWRCAGQSSSSPHFRTRSIKVVILVSSSLTTLSSSALSAVPIRGAGTRVIHAPKLATRSGSSARSSHSAREARNSSNCEQFTDVPRRVPAPFPVVDDDRQNGRVLAAGTQASLIESMKHSDRVVQHPQGHAPVDGGLELEQDQQIEPTSRQWCGSSRACQRVAGPDAR